MITLYPLLFVSGSRINLSWISCCRYISKQTIFLPDNSGPFSRGQFIGTKFSSKSHLMWRFQKLGNVTEYEKLFIVCTSIVHTRRRQLEHQFQIARCRSTHDNWEGGGSPIMTYELFLATTPFTPKFWKLSYPFRKFKKFTNHSKTIEFVNICKFLTASENFITPGKNCSIITFVLTASVCIGCMAKSIAASVDSLIRQGDVLSTRGSCLLCQMNLSHV